MAPLATSCEGTRERCAGGRVGAGAQRVELRQHLRQSGLVERQADLANNLGSGGASVRTEQNRAALLSRANSTDCDDVTGTLCVCLCWPVAG